MVQFWKIPKVFIKLWGSPSKLYKRTEMKTCLTHPSTETSHLKGFKRCKKQSDCRFYQCFTNFFPIHNELRLIFVRFRDRKVYAYFWTIVVIDFWICSVFFGKCLKKFSSGDFQIGISFYRFVEFVLDWCKDQMQCVNSASLFQISHSCFVTLIRWWTLFREILIGFTKIGPCEN